MDDLHRDRAEPFANAQRAHIAHQRAHEAAPIESVMVVEAAILRSDEGLLDIRWHFPQLDVHAPNDREAADQATVFVDDSAALTWMEGTNFGGARAPRVAAGEEPRVDGDHSHDARDEQRQADPMTLDQCMKRKPGGFAQALPEQRYERTGR